MNINKYLDICEKVSKLYDLLFISIVADTLKKDLHTMMLRIKDNSEGHETLEDIILYEVLYYNRDHIRNMQTGSYGILWTKRTLEFINVFLIMLVQNPSWSSSKCAKDTYVKVLSKYHNWMTSTTAKLVMNTIPSREDIFDKITVSEYIEELNPLISSIQCLLLANDLDFQDKV